jgi:4-amino-4-deoxy-L-arabinose transferase-like glycosyltransferase
VIPEGGSIVRSFARSALPIVAAVFAACCVVQVFLAGLGVFDTAERFATHREFGYMFGLLTIVMIVLALLGRQSRRIVGVSVLLFVLFVLQSVFILFREDTPAIAALHPLNGFLILGGGIALTRASWLERQARSEDAAPSTPRPALDRA